jgi:ABC-type polysaccharide/polyol phosphate export permease
MQLGQHLKELHRYRALLVSLVGRDLQARYRGSALGFLWTFLNPLLLLSVYALVFNVYFRVQMEHYAVFVFTGLLPWIFFSQVLLEGCGAIAEGGSLVTKVLFPLQLLPAVKVLSGFANYILSLPILVVFLLASGMGIHLTWLALPLVALVQLCFTYALTLILATANVFMRDTRHILANLMTLWFFLTPVLYPLAQVPEKYHVLVYLNPAAVFTLAYHELIFRGGWPRWDLLGSVALLSLLLLAAAVALFDHYKEYFAEKI